MKALIKNVEDKCRNQKLKMPISTETPMQLSYIPEFDSSPELNTNNITFYQELIGILKWSTKIRWVDICRNFLFYFNCKSLHVKDIYNSCCIFSHIPWGVRSWCFSLTQIYQTKIIQDLSQGQKISKKYIESRMNICWLTINHVGNLLSW